MRPEAKWIYLFQKIKLFYFESVINFLVITALVQRNIDFRFEYWSKDWRKLAFLALSFIKSFDITSQKSLYYKYLGFYAPVAQLDRVADFESEV